MKRTLTKIAAVLGFFLLTAIGLHKIYDVLRWKDTTGGYLSSVNQLYSTDKDLIDVVFLGSSHCYHGIYPELLWEDCGIAAFDMAVSAQDIDSTYYHLKELLKTQSPKVVVADVYGIFHEQHQVESNIYRNYLSLKTSPTSIAHVLTYGKRNGETAPKIQDLLARWPIIHTRYAELKEFDFISYEPSIIGRGSYLTWNITPAEEGNGVSRCKEITPLSERNRKWLDQLTLLSVEEDFKLIFIMIPYKREDDKQAILNGFKEYIAERPVDFVDLSEPDTGIDLCSDTDWHDPEHLNAFGAAKLTRYMENYITEKCELPDRRGDEKYILWDKALERYRQMEGFARLSTAASNEEYFTMLADIPRITCVLSLEGEYADSPTELYNCVSCFHMEYEDYLRGGKWLYRDGQLTKLCENIAGTEAVVDLSRTDTLKVSYLKDFDDNNILIDGVSYKNTWSGLQVVVYDELEQKVALNVEMH